MTLKDLVYIIAILDDDKENRHEKIMTMTGCEFSDDTLEKVSQTMRQYGSEQSKWPTSVRFELIKLPPKKMPPQEKLHLWPDGEYRTQEVPAVFKKTYFNDLTPKDKDWIRQIMKYGYYILNRDKLSQQEIERNPDYISNATYEYKCSLVRGKYGIADRTLRDWVKFLQISLKSDSVDVLAKAKERKLGDAKYYMVTCAVNNTKVATKAWENMLAYAKKWGAEVSVIPLRYKNPTSRLEKENQPSKEWWDDRVMPYLDLNRHQIGHNLELLSDVKTQPTASYPLDGTHVLSGENSCIIGHPKMHMKPIPVLEGEHKKMAYTTGAITYPDYTDTKAGKKGEFHHCFGFVMVEVDGLNNHIRQVPVADDGSFIDLIYEVRDGKVSEIDSVTAFRMGDIHVGDHDPEKIKASLGLINRLKPEYVILDDVFNGHSINPHEAKDPIIKYQRIREGRNTIDGEIREMIEWLHYFKKEANSKLVVVRSNHDDFLDRYVRSQDWKGDLVNAPEFMQYTGILLSGKAPKGLIPYLIEEEFGDEIITLTLDDSFRPGDIEHAHHGHIGANGSRGSALLFSNLPTKTMTAHTHSPWRLNGSSGVGTSTILRVGYNTGASSWRQSDAIEFNNGKHQHIIYQDDGSFTTMF